MRRYRKWALTLGIMAATPGITTAAGPLSMLKPKAAAESAAPAASSKQSNQKVADEIGRALRGAQLKGFDIEIEYKNGVATLSGKIADARQKAQATRLASEVPGVKRVDNQLTLIQQGASPVAARGAAPSTRPRSMIRQVSGEVEAAPAATPSPAEFREAATTAAIQTNQKVAQDVANALQAAHLNGYDIEVQYQNGAALLQGSVASPEHRAMASKVASEVPGVRMVNNQLAVQQQQGPAQQQFAPQQGPMMRPIAPAGYLPPGAPGAPPMAMGPGMAPEPAAGNPGAIYDQPHLPDYAWPTYADYPNYAQVAYPQQYSASAWPYIGPFYPYPQVPLGWRRVTLEWDDGAWNLDFNSRTDKWWWFLHPKNW